MPHVASRLRVVFAVSLAAALGAAPAPPALAQDEQKRALADPFFTYDREPEYDVVTTNDVSVPLRDGAHLGCDLHQPGSGGSVAPGRFPGIVYEYTAYAVTHPATDVSFFVTRGYNVIVCDARGSGRSPGELDPFSLQEQLDNYDLIEWFAVQPWSDGNIGQTGLSYGGHTSNLVAVNQPPHLRTIIPAMAIHDWYANTIYRGGIESPSIWSWNVTLPALGAGAENPDIPVDSLRNVLLEYRNHPLYDDYWRERSVMARWDRLTIPVLGIGGWYDRYRDGMTKNYTARRDNMWLVMGPWTHGAPQGQPGEIGLGGYLAWFDHWLKGMRSAPLPQAKVTTYELPEPGAGRGWHQYSDWPPPQVADIRMHLTADHALAAQAGAAGRHTYTVDAFDPGNDRSHATTVNQGDQREEDERRLTYTTAPFTQDTVLAGAVVATLATSFTATDGNVVVRLMDVAPDGTSLRISAGWLKASHYRGHDHLEEIAPGQAYPLTIQVWPQHYRFPKGHALRLSISSGDFPEIAADAPPGEVTVLVGEGGSFADVPIVQPARGIAAACPPRRVPPSGYADVGRASTHAPAIDCLTWWGIAQGRSATQYAPQAPTSRGQLATFLVRLLDDAGAALPAGGDRFSDDDGSAHEASINALAGAGLVSGRSSSRFAPLAPVTRAELATLLVRAYERAAGRQLPPGDDAFDDDDGNTHEAAINRAAGAGFVAGTSESTYEPTQATDRAQTASVLVRVLAQLVDDDKARLSRR